MKIYTETGNKIDYNNFIIYPVNWYYKSSCQLFDVTYNVYFKNRSFFTAYTGTLAQVKEDLKKYM